MAPFLPRAPKKKRADKAHESKSTSLPVAPPTRIGFGEYFHPTLHDKAGRYAKLEFIGKIEEIAQEVLVDLAESVRPNYERIRAVMDQDELLSLDAETLRQVAKNGRNDFGGLLAALETWTERYSLNADWVRNMALRTLFHWTGRIVVTKGQRLQFVGPISAMKSDLAEIPFSFSADGWAITNQTENAFVAKATADFEAYLGGYVRRVRSQAEEAGWIKTPQVRKSGKDSDAFRHFEWLVRWQCQRWTTTEIARKYAPGKTGKVKTAQKANVVPNSANSASERSGYAAEKDMRRQAAYRAVHKGLAKAAGLVDIPLRSGKQADANNLS